MIGVLVLTGFLGSGKTTLLRHLLRQPQFARTAVIINEFGEIGLDHLLVEVVDGEIAVLPSGCVCCTLRSDLQQTLTDLLIRRDRAEIPPFSRILVETTGLADPAPIVQLLLNNPLVSHFVRLDTVVTTVDAVNGIRQIDEHAEAVKQAALADRLLLTKADLAAGDEIDLLATSVNAMLDRIVGLMETVRQISVDVAHDLRTPLARLRQGLESTKFKARSPADYATAVDKAIGEAKRTLIHDHVDHCLAACRTEGSILVSAADGVADHGDRGDHSGCR